MAILDAKTQNTREKGASFPFSHRLRRLAWSIVWGCFASWTPAPMHGWRRFLLRLFGASLHPTSRVYGRAKVWDPRNLEMGSFACIGPGANCYCMARISLGSHSLVSQGAHLCAGTHDIDDPHFQLQARPIQIGDSAWIAAEAFVGPGVVVGSRAVLGARAVTFSSLVPDGVYVGNPAKLLRLRGNSDQ